MPIPEGFRSLQEADEETRAALVITDSAALFITPSQWRGFHEKVSHLEIGQAIRQRRREMGLTQEELAARRWRSMAE